jgi:hypothetical protein
MLARLAADLLVALHFSFILFVVFGAFAAFRWRWVIWLHLPAAVWGALIEFQDWTCPLTPWENRLREMAGEEGFSGGFIEHYLLSVIYPEGLTRNVQLVLGSLVLLINLGAYGWLVSRKAHRGGSAAQEQANG